MRLNEGIALRCAFTSQNALLSRAIITDRERQRSPMGMRLNEEQRPALSAHMSAHPAALALKRFCGF
jgi:hypothetical protein